MQQSMKRLPDFVVTGNRQRRRVKCGYCGGWQNVSIVPHMRAAHPREWGVWKRDFVHRWNLGFSAKRIMASYNRLFTWTVIEREIKGALEKNPRRIALVPKKSISNWKPRGFKIEKTTIWRFGKRGDWAIHSPEYRGNWAPQVPRNLILTCTRKGDWVLDPFVGGGTTAIECLLEGRNVIGVDINPVAIAITRRRIDQMKKLAKSTHHKLPKVEVRVRQGDARSLGFIPDASIRLVCAHPPYADMLEYTQHQTGDLSRIHDLDQYYNEIREVASELFRVLKKGGICAVLIGDIRRKGRFEPLEHRVLAQFEDVGFETRERIVKEQFHDRSTEFYLDLRKGHWLKHEYLLIFAKPGRRSPSRHALKVIDS